MKVALVNPGNDLRKMFGMYAAAMQPQVPQGLCYVGACLDVVVQQEGEVTSLGLGGAP